MTLTNAATAQPTFTAPAVTADTSLAFTLTVSDGNASDTDTVTVTVEDTTLPNRPPVANAGPESDGGRRRSGDPRRHGQLRPRGPHADVCVDTDQRDVGDADQRDDGRNRRSRRPRSLPTPPWRLP